MRAPRAVLVLFAAAALAGCNPDSSPVTAEPDATPRFDGGGWLGGGGKTTSTDSTLVAESDSGIATTDGGTTLGSGG